MTPASAPVMNVISDEINTPEEARECMRMIMEKPLCFNEKRQNLIEWKRELNRAEMENLPPGYENMATDKSAVLISDSFPSNIFQSNLEDIINRIVNYFTVKQIMIHDMNVTTFKNYGKYPNGIVPEGVEVPELYRLEIVCDALVYGINDMVSKESFDAHVRTLRFSIPGVNLVRFYKKTMTQRSKPRVLQEVAIVYVNNNPVNGVLGTIRSTPMTLEFRRQYLTFEIEFKTQINTFKEQLKDKKQRLQDIRWQAECVAFSDAIMLYERLIARDAC
jgi:hypothetical protein